MRTKSVATCAGAVFLLFALSECNSTEGAEPSGRGLVFGLNFAKIRGSDVGTYVDSRFGIRVGGYVSYQVSETLAIQPEFAFSMRGFDYTYPGWEDTLKLDYLEFAALAKAYLLPEPGAGSNAKPYVFAGPSLALKVFEKWESGDPVSGDLNFLDFGLVLGGGAEFDTGKGTMSAELRYHLGLTEIEDGYDVKHSVLTLGMTYSY